MDNDAQQIDAQALLNQMAHLQAQLQHLQAAAANDQRGDALQLHQDIIACIPGHLQQVCMDASQRKQIMRAYPKSTPDLPKIIKDDNGLGAKAISDATSRKWLTSLVPTFQRDNLDVARVAAAGLQLSFDFDGDSAARVQHLHGTLRDVLVLACDNAQKLAETQLKLTFEAAGAKGAYSLMDLSPTTQDLDFSDGNLLQQSHIEAIQELRKFNASFIKPNNNKHRPGHYLNRGGRGGRGRGGRGAKNYFGGRGGRQNNYDNKKGQQD